MAPDQRRLNVEHITSRVCFHLDLRGPNVSAMAACATSLLAIHLAVQALRQGDCDLALAGGAAVAAPHWPGYLAVDGGPVSLSGTVRPFDERADGTVFGSGVGVVVLKRLGEAMADGDHVHAVVLGTGIYNDGGQKNSLAAPAIDGQIAAISKALEIAQIGPETIGFVEAHGTGTLVGDPIEVEAMSQVYRRHTDRKQYCALGAVKANIGHTSAAAGVLGLIKACLALEHGVIPPNIHFDQPSPRLDLPATPFFVPTASTPWRSDGHPRRAGVSAFGFGGNNAHVVLEAPPPVPVRIRQDRPEVVVLSARTSTALDRQIERLADHLEDVAHTLQTGRKTFHHRAAVVASDTAEAKDRLSGCAVHRGEGREAPPVIFALPGQGSQRAGMGHALFREDVGYRAEVDRCAELLLPHLNLDIRSLLHAEDGEAVEKIEQTEFSQPALFVVEYALARRLIACGVEPAAIVGHSIGELVAACLAGVFTLSDALALVTARGRLMQACAPGSMMAIFLSAADVEARLIARHDAVEIAASNAPEFTVVSGPSEAIECVRSELEDEDLTYRVLRTSHGFHSESMKPAVAPFRDVLSQIERAAPRLPFVSNVSGRLITDDEATDHNYWASQIRKPVQFAQAVETLTKIAGAVWIEVGPGSALSSLIRQQTDGATVIATLDGDRQGHDGFLDVLSHLWVKGVQVSQSSLGYCSRQRTAILPTYPFETQNYWIDPPNFELEAAPDSTAAQEDASLGEGQIHAQDWLHVPGWREVPLRTPVLEPNDGWLIFVDRAGLGLKLRARLQEAGARILSLHPAQQFNRTGPGEYDVRPGVAGDLVNVLREGTTSGFTLRRVLHLWQVTGRPDAQDDPQQTFANCVALGFDTLTAFVQALYEYGVADDVDVSVAADGVATLEGEEGPICWEKASLIGPCRVAPIEMPSFSFQLIDVPADALSAPWLADGLLAEAAAPEAGTVKALRKRGRYIEAFRPLPDTHRPGEMRTGGVALITGGMGGLGLEVAGRLFDMTQMRLALLTRWQPPPVDEWPERAKATDRIGQALRKVMALKARGADVLVVRGDAAVAEDMARVVDEVRERFGAIDGVVHAAGIPSRSLILDTTHQGAYDLMAPKVDGALILEDLLGDQPLDFFVSFSSVASVAPVAGQGRLLRRECGTRCAGHTQSACRLGARLFDRVGCLAGSRNGGGQGEIAECRRSARRLGWAGGRTCRPPMVAILPT